MLLTAFASFAFRRGKESCWDQARGHGPRALWGLWELRRRCDDGPKERKAPAHSGMSKTVGFLPQWLSRPRRDPFVDLRGTVEACGDDRACEFIPIPQRPTSDFLWQRSPFLLYGGGAGLVEGPGIDFILPYWMARFY